MAVGVGGNGQRRGGAAVGAVVRLGGADRLLLLHGSEHLEPPLPAARAGAAPRAVRARARERARGREGERARARERGQRESERAREQESERERARERA
eukprot:1343401-Prymnesium_polylepis.1